MYRINTIQGKAAVAIPYPVAEETRMKPIEKPGELIDVAARQGIELTELEANLILGYMEGHDFGLMMDETGGTFLNDLQAEHENPPKYSIKNAIEFCKEMNDDMVKDTCSEGEGEDGYLFELQKDEFILGMLSEKANHLIPTQPGTFNVEIVEELKKIVSIEAENWEEATQMVKEEWENGVHVLSADDFAEVTFNIVASPSDN